jgi:hypothetical protein
MIHEHFKKLNMKRGEILEKAIQQFAALTGTGMKILQNNELNDTGNIKEDAKIELTMGQQKTQFLVEIKNELRENTMHHLLNQFQKNQGEWLLVCQYIPKPIKESLKTNGINYLETAGNCFIRKDGLFFYINDRQVTEQRQPKEGKLWKQAGLKFLFGILINPELLNKTYRQIAGEAKVALGNIGPFIEELKLESFVKEGIRNGQPFLFIDNKEQLQNKWIGLFNAVLRPKLKQGRFRFLNNNDLNNWKKAATAIPKKFYWGGEPAGALLTGFLQPEIFTVYTKEPKTEIMKHLRLVPDKNGNVEILDIFWNTPAPDILDVKTNHVPAFLAYAELMTSPDSRNRETAERIKQKYLG